MGIQTIDPKKVKELALAGISQQDIATHQGVNQPAISKFLTRENIEKSRLKLFKDNKANEFEQDQLEAVDIQRDIRKTWSKDVISRMTENEKRAIHHTLTIDIGTKEDKITAIKGLSGSNNNPILQLILDADKIILSKTVTTLEIDSVKGESKGNNMPNIPPSVKEMATIGVDDAEQDKDK